MIVLFFGKLFRFGRCMCRSGFLLVMHVVVASVRLAE